MIKKNTKDRVLILGASGFIGSAIYRELNSYFKTFGTYTTDNKMHQKNKHFFQYNASEDDIFEILNITKPTVIISALRGDFSSLITAHQHIVEYTNVNKNRFIFISSANVFDAYSKYPSYEHDTTLSNSIYGHFKIKIEHILRTLPKKQAIILRVPMVFGSQSPRIEELKQQLHEKTPIEIFPNLIMNVTTDSKLTQQVHYIINQKKHGIFHLGSKDLVHHDEFIKNIINTLGIYNPVFKYVYTTNDDRYLAVLPKENCLPRHLQIYSQDVLTELKI